MYIYIHTYKRGLAIQDACAHEFVRKVRRAITITAKETYIHAKEAYIHAKEAYIHAKETHIHANETSTYAKET